jgi:hypothetical protein
MDDLEPIAATELDTPALDAEAETELPETPVDLDEVDTSGDDDGAEQPEPEFVTFVADDGTEYQLPKALEGSLLKNKDYTTKTQAVAEERKALEARNAEIEERLKATDEELDTRATLRTITTELAEYQKLTAADWQAHMNNDPLGTQQHRLRFETLRDQKAELEGKVSQAANARTEKAQQDLAQRVQQTIDFAAKEIPGFKPELTEKLITFAMGEMGVPEAALQANWSPTFYKLLHRAYVGEQSLKKQTAALKPAPTPAPAPLVTVTPKTNAAGRRTLGDLAKSGDMEAYAAARKAGRG